MAISKTGARQMRQMAPRCGAIPGLMWYRRDAAKAKQELAKALEMAEENELGLVPRSDKDNHPDALANLWFIRAIHEFGRYAAHHREDDLVRYYTHALLPAATRIVQRFFSENGIDRVRMDDGGMLMPHRDSATTGGPTIAHPQGLRLNALWYFALEGTGQALKAQVSGARGAGGGATGMNSTAHHFERLASRLRRSFAKTFWCEEHNRICTPAARLELNHGQLGDPDQLLVSMLPASPLPRTKQRQILKSFQANAVGALGVKMRSPMYGVVESPLHLVWLARGVGIDDPAAAAKLLLPLEALHEAAQKMLVHCCYRDEKVYPPGSHRTDPIASAEILGASSEFKTPG